MLKHVQDHIIDELRAENPYLLEYELGKQFFDRIFFYLTVGS